MTTVTNIKVNGHCLPGSSCSKLTMSLVNIFFKISNVNISNMPIFFVEKIISLIFSTKNISVFGYKVVKHLTA